MNIGVAIYYPAMLYSLLLVAIWVVSWFAGVVRLFISGDTGVNSLISAEGVRWALRSAETSLEAAPWGTALLCVVSFGLLYGSGLLHTIAGVLCGDRPSANRRHAGLMSLVVLLVSLLLLFVCTIAPWHILMGVTSQLSTSPLFKGWLLLLFLITLFVSAMHGAVYGSYRISSDVMRSVCDMVAYFSPAFVAMLPASGVVPCLQYTGMLSVTDGTVVDILNTILYLFPFIYLSLLRFALRVK